MEQPILRNSYEWILELLSTFPAVEIIGARQVGKSTLTHMISERLRQPVQYVTLDDPETLNAAIGDPRGFLAAVNTGSLVIDEAQRAPELLLPLKASIDADRTPGRFILTGSSRISTSARAADSLAGRLMSCQLYGFSQGELIQTQEDFVSRILSGINQFFVTELTRADYAQMITTGCMPAVQVLSSTKMRKTWYNSYLERILTKDMQDVANITQPEKMRSLLAELAAIQGSEAVIGRLANLANIPASTARDYIDHLGSLQMISQIQPWSSNLLKREVEKPKIVLNDQGLATYLTKVTASTLEDVVKGQALGGFLEAFVCTELLKQRTWSENTWDMFHYRSPDGREIDLIIETEDGGIIGIEVKAAASTSPSDFKHLRWLRDRIPERFIAGIVLNTDTQARMLDRGIYAFPVAALWQS